MLDYVSYVVISYLVISTMFWGMLAVSTMKLSRRISDVSTSTEVVASIQGLIQNGFSISDSVKVVLESQKISLEALVKQVSEMSEDKKRMVEVILSLEMQSEKYKSDIGKQHEKKVGDLMEEIKKIRLETTGTIQKLESDLSIEKEKNLLLMRKLDSAATMVPENRTQTQKNSVTKPSMAQKNTPKSIRDLDKIDAFDDDVEQIGPRVRIVPPAKKSEAEVKAEQQKAASFFL